MDVEVRPTEPADEPAVSEVVRTAFDGSRHGDDGARVVELATALRARADMQADLVAVAGSNQSEIVGHTHLSVSWVDAPQALVTVLVLSPLAVAPAYQSRGIGGVLQTAALEAARDLGVPLVFLEGDPHYYARHGWRPALDLGFIAPSVRIPEPAFQVTTLPGYDPAAMTGHVIYNDTFWAFDCVGLRR